MLRVRMTLRCGKMGLVLGVYTESSDNGNKITTHSNDLFKELDKKYNGQLSEILNKGGISLKPASNMDKMQADMGGAACVVGTILAASARNWKIHIKGIVLLTENYKATKPGDVVFAMNGKSIQVDNTDGEGRLLLADALSCAQKFNPKAATLTGAIIVALGAGAAGVFSNAEELWNTLNKACYVTGDRVWTMPHYRLYTKISESILANFNKISGSSYELSCVAAAFLQEFVNSDTKWIHVDIASVMKKKKEVPYLCLGMTAKSQIIQSYKEKIKGIRKIIQMYEELKKDALQTLKGTEEVERETIELAEKRNETLREAIEMIEKLKRIKIAEMEETAIAVAIGAGAAGAFYNDDEVWNTLNKAGYVTGDRVWRMVLYRLSTKQISESILAYLNKISGSSYGLSCVAANFLQGIVNSGTKWMHVDIASVIKNKAEVSYFCLGVEERCQIIEEIQERKREMIETYEEMEKERRQSIEEMEEYIRRTIKKFAEKKEGICRIIEKIEENRRREIEEIEEISCEMASLATT